jgi:hypothetical protein
MTGQTKNEGFIMLSTSFPVIAAWADAAILTLAGLINLSRLQAVRKVYANWDIPRPFYRTIGLLQLYAAMLLAMPEMRLWGIVLAAPILFGSVVTLLNHQRYAVALPVVLMMAGLMVAVLAIPPLHADYVQLARY